MASSGETRGLAPTSKTCLTTSRWGHSRGRSETSPEPRKPHRIHIEYSSRLFPPSCCPRHPCLPATPAFLPPLPSCPWYVYMYLSPCALPPPSGLRRSPHQGRLLLPSNPDHPGGFISAVILIPYSYTYCMQSVQAIVGCCDAMQAP